MIKLKGKLTLNINDRSYLKYTSKANEFNKLAAKWQGHFVQLRKSLVGPSIYNSTTDKTKIVHIHITYYQETMFGTPLSRVMS